MTSSISHLAFVVNGGDSLKYRFAQDGSPSIRGRFVTYLNRITQNPLTMGGKACIRGMRVTVGMIVGQIGAGRGIDKLLADYPYLEREDILQALRDQASRPRRPRHQPK
jgi:uncharacterized protein (DUF433 family)